MSQQAAPCSSRALCGMDKTLQRGWSRGSWSQVGGRVGEENLHPFQCPYLSPTAEGVSEEKWCWRGCLGGERRGGNLPGREQCKEKDCSAGGKEEKGIWE